MMDYKNVELIQFLVSKDGLLGKALKTLIHATLPHIFDREGPEKKDDRKEWRTTENCLRWGADANYRFEDGYPWM